MSKTREDIEKEIEKLESDIFEIEMCDHLSNEDYVNKSEYRRRIRDLKEQLKEM